MQPVIFCHGTWGRFHDWHYNGSVLWKAMQDKGFSPTDFLWSGYCGGITDFVIVPKSSAEMKGELMLWKSEGEKLAWFCQLLGYDRPNVVSHSHGLQIVTMAANAGQEFDHVLSISGPIREDMQLYRQKARPNIKKWIQVVDPKDDMTIRAGEEEDNGIHVLGFAYDLPEADPDCNIHADGFGHSKLLLDIAAWEQLGIWQRFLT